MIQPPDNSPLKIQLLHPAYALYKAIKEQNRAMIISLLAKEHPLWDIRYMNRPGRPRSYSLLQFAAKYGEPDILSLFLEHPKVTQFSCHVPPLLLAIRRGDPKILQTMLTGRYSTERLKKGFFENSFKDKEGNGPFHYASEIADPNKRKEIAKILLCAHFDVYQLNNTNALPEKIREFEGLRSQLLPTLTLKQKIILSVGLILTTLNLVLFKALPLLPNGLYANFSLIFSLSTLAGLMIGTIAYWYFMKRHEIDSRRALKQQYRADFYYQIKHDLLNHEKVMDFIKKGVNVLEEKALNTAITHGHTQQIKCLLEAGSIPTFNTLNTCIKASNRVKVAFGAFKMLIENYTFDFSDKRSERLVSTAIFLNKVEFLALLLKKGAYCGQGKEATDLLHAAKIKSASTHAHTPFDLLRYLSLRDPDAYQPMLNHIKSTSFELTPLPPCPIIYKGLKRDYNSTPMYRSSEMRIALKKLNKRLKSTQKNEVKHESETPLLVPIKLYRMPS